MKKKLVCLLTIICCLGLAGCSPGEKSAGPAQSGPVIRIGVMPDVESIPLVIAEKNGYFDREGVQVELVHFKSARDRDSALQSGELDGVITDMVAVVFANEGGIDLKAISRIDGNVELLAGSSSDIQTIAGLKGKDVGISSNTIMEYLWLELFMWFMNMLVKLSLATVALSAGSMSAQSRRSVRLQRCRQLCRLSAPANTSGKYLAWRHG